MPETPYDFDFEPSLRTAARRLEMALRLIEFEDLLADTYEGERARLALASALASAARQFAAFWPRAYADAEAFKASFRLVNLLRVRALDGRVEASVVAEAASHVRSILDAVKQALEASDRG